MVTKRHLSTESLLTKGPFVWGILIPELEDNSEKGMGANKCISRDLSVLSQTIECIGMLLKKESVQTNELEHFRNTSSKKRLRQTNGPILTIQRLYVQYNTQL